MTARVLDGRAVAKEVYADVAKAVSERAARGGARPKLASSPKTTGCPQARRQKSCSRWSSD